MTLNKQDPRAQILARDIAALIREYEAETENRVEGLSIEKPALGLYDVQMQIRMSVRSLNTFTHSTAVTAHEQPATARADEDG